MLPEFVRPIVRPEFQIAPLVVQRVVILVVDTFLPEQRTPHPERHYQTMLHHVSVSSSHVEKIWRTPHIPD
jgi:hypothetical protein